MFGLPILQSVDVCWCECPIGDTAREVAEMMIFRTATGREIVYVETRWSKVNVYPHLERALAKV